MVTKQIQGAETPGPSASHARLQSSWCFALFFCFCFCFWLRWVFVAVQAFSSCGERGLLFIGVRGLLTVVASLVAEHGL